MEKNLVLEKLRKKNNFTYQEMADFIGVSKPYYWQLENNQRRLYYDLAVKIARALRTKPDELFYHQYENDK
ncbi:MAG: helix-turn-helix transcriptional regulator [Mollicutes bacterium]|jgi:putative transcriptional regulator|nr:helix-turn-helix transcriptional regulator [Mollicutes bacterium]